MRFRSRRSNSVDESTHEAWSTTSENCLPIYHTWWNKMATTNYEIARERRKFYQAMNQDTVSSESSGSRSNLESESRSKRHANKKVSSSCKQTRLHKTDNTEVVRRVIVSESNEDDDSNNEDVDRSESEQIMVPSGEYLIGAEIMTSILKLLYHNRARNMSRWFRIRLSDPSEWNSSHIASWISWCSRTFSIRPIAAILPSTGKELLKLSLRDWQKIGGGTEGRILARHLGYLHLQATGVHTPDLLQENEDSVGESSLIYNKFKIN